jgi:hypothetical protein
MSAAAPTAGWRNRITGTGEEAPDQLLANPANWRTHPKAQQDALAGALDGGPGSDDQLHADRRDLPSGPGLCHRPTEPTLHGSSAGTRGR